MNDFEKYYENLDAKNLVVIIESKQRYKPEVITFCKERLFRMNMPNSDLVELAKDFFRKEYYNYFAESKHWYNESIDLNSFFLTIKEAKKCFEESKAEYIANRKNATRDLPSG